MITVETIYKTDDGTKFATREEAVAHDSALSDLTGIIAALTGELRPTTGNVQHAEGTHNALRYQLFVQQEADAKALGPLIFRSSCVDMYDREWPAPCTVANPGGRCEAINTNPLPKEYAMPDVYIAKLSESNDLAKIRDAIADDAARAERDAAELADVTEQETAHALEAATFAQGLR